MSTRELNIISQCRKGDRVAQKALYDRYRTRWFMICLRYVRERHDALDTLQNALVSIYSNLDTYNPDNGTFSAWSSRIVVNACLMFLRKKNGKRQLQNGYEDVSATSTNHSPLEEMSAQEIMQVISKLPDGYRTIFNLYAIEGYTHQEIADELNISVGTSKSQLFKARKFLQGQIQKLFEIVYP